MKLIGGAALRLVWPSFCVPKAVTLLCTTAVDGLKSLRGFAKFEHGNSNNFCATTPHGRPLTVH